MAITKDTNLWGLFPQYLKNTDQCLKKSKARHVNTKKEAEIIQFLFQFYFRQLRPLIREKGLDTQVIDLNMENLKNLLSKRSYRQAYLEVLKNISKKFSEIEIQNEYFMSEANQKASISMTKVEKNIYDTLLKLDIQIATSYKQLIIDVNDSGRISFKGTIHELREVLREVLAKLAPDTDVEKSVGFKLEKDCTKPTMKQKVRFIFRLREASTNETKVAEDSVMFIEISEDKIADLTRNLYNSGSNSSHTKAIRNDVIKSKMYLDAILSHLLEVQQ